MPVPRRPSVEIFEPPYQGCALRTAARESIAAALMKVWLCEQLYDDTGSRYAMVRAPGVCSQEVVATRSSWAINIMRYKGTRTIACHSAREGAWITGFSRDIRNERGSAGVSPEPVVQTQDFGTRTDTGDRNPLWHRADP